MGLRTQGDRGASPDVRQRLLTGAVALMRQRGVDGFGMAELLEKSAAARGSAYQHFPQGKQQLLAAAAAEAVTEMTAMIQHLVETKSPGEMVVALMDWWKRLLQKTDYAYGCPVVAASLGAQNYPEAGEAAAAGFQRFSGLFAAALQQHGFAADRAAALGSLALSAIEGAIIQARSLRSTEPLDVVADHFRILFREGSA
ncbi:MAG: TetR/AcrR family transcriptional regulator [Segniliparus sp.]|uniref:TetR/AcrR family transcriptional regulator n=1 Tax=Segniliparus sp. TaxID=2804064 RepID=UPI003F2B3BE1